MSLRQLQEGRRQEAQALLVANERLGGLRFRHDISADGEGRGQIGQEGVGAGGGELLVEADGFLGLGEGLFAATERAEAVG